MKTLKVLLLIALVIQFSCDKNDSDEINIDVDTYVQLLKSSQYDSSQLPAFTYKDIPALLQYRSEDEIITHFPHNPISSLYGPECQLGIYVLWTIESIRAVSIKSERVIMRFPSQNPILAHKDSARLYLISDDKSHEVAAKAYYDWWKKNEHKDFEDFKNTDPLEKTDYRWH